MKDCLEPHLGAGKEAIICKGGRTLTLTKNGIAKNLEKRLGKDKKGGGGRVGMKSLSAKKIKRK